jgi:hypothetical protein
MIAYRFPFGDWARMTIHNKGQAEARDCSGRISQYRFGVI